VLVVVVVGYGQNVPTGVSVGGSSASKLISIVASTGLSVGEDLWYVFLSSSGTGTVSVQTKAGANNYLNVIAQSFTGTVTSAPFFEKTATNSAAGSSISVTVDSGTIGRRIIMAVAAPNSSSSFSLGSGQRNILSTQGNLRFADLNYEDSSAQQTMSLTNFGVATNLVTIGTAILPSSTSPTISLWNNSSNVANGYFQKIVFSTGQANTGMGVPIGNTWKGIIATFKANPVTIVMNKSPFKINDHVGIVAEEELQGTGSKTAA
jgi:hypothetical protein